MAELLALFRFLVPYFAAVPKEIVEQALTMAADYRPACLTTAGQDKAQVYYAASLLYSRKLQEDAANSPAIPQGVTSEKEGDLQRTYGRVEGADDPFGWWGDYLKLAALCTGGAITVGSRWNTCCPPPWVAPCTC